MSSLDALKTEVRACTLCAAHLPLGPRPVVRGNTSAKILVIGQAPGTKVHESGLSWNDKSGDRLRDWMGVDREIFYNEDWLANIPMGFCYPGRLKNGGDAPPRPECAPAWHAPLIALLPNIQLTLLVGMYAHAYYLAETKKKTMTETVRSFGDYGPDVIPLPHPSWRTTGWQKKNPWFETDVLPVLRACITQLR